MTETLADRIRALAAQRRYEHLGVDAQRVLRREIADALGTRLQNVAKALIQTGVPGRPPKTSPIKKLPKKRMGRPAVPDDQRLTVQIGLNMTQSDWELLESTAEERGVRPAELLRQLIRGLAKQKAGSPAR